VHREINPREVQDRYRDPEGAGTRREVAQNVLTFSSSAMFERAAGLE
jgi:hypothetical protein